MKELKCPHCLDQRIDFMREAGKSRTEKGTFYHSAHGVSLRMVHDTHRTSLEGEDANHILNFGHGRDSVFHKDEDYAASVNLMREANQRIAMRLT